MGIQMAPVLYDLVRLKGGMDQVTPPLSLAPGFIRRGSNFECSITGGYSRIAGYERYDGHASPSAAIYSTITRTVTGAVAVGNTITGVTSAATAEVLLVSDTLLVFTRQTGTFVVGETLNVAASPVGVIEEIVSAVADGLTDATYRSLAADEYRTSIAAVPGSGSILGVSFYNGVVYAWRNNAGGTAAEIYKSTASGWSLVALGRELAFTAGGSHATGTVTLATGAAGSVDTIKVDGIDIMSGAVAYNTSLSQTATDVASNITAHTSVPNFTAVAVGTTITITAVTPGTNTDAVTVTSTTITTTDTDMTGGGVSIAAGDVITGATSGATATVTRVMLQSGTFAAGTAAGKLIFASDTGTFQAESLNIPSYPGIATIAGDSSAITLLPGGKVETVIANFGGGTANYRMYGADGVNRGFEFDGTVYCPITTGMTTDTPLHVSVHKQHLFFSFGASLQFSGLGLPYQWSPILGAGEIAMNASITNILPLPGDQSSGALGVYTRRDTSVLYGTSSATFALATFNSGTGALAYSAQTMDQAYVLDDRGIMSLGTSLNFGNFLPSSLTMNLRPFLLTKAGLTIGSTVSRNKGQYRVFFSDGTGLYMTVLNGKLLGTIPVQFAHNTTCVFEGEDTTGEARIFFGASNGMVYELDKGTSFDGEDIAASITMVFNSINSPRILKRFRKASLEVSGDSYAEIAFGYDLGYRTTQIDQAIDEEYTKDLRSSYWDEFTWDSFIWDGEELSPMEIDVNGTAENIAVRLSSNSDLLDQFTVNSVILHYSQRRGMR